MSGAKPTIILLRTAAVLSLSVVLSGCTYDYNQHSDRVAYSAGEAVKANLARETEDPSNKSMNKTSDLGKNGNVIPVDAAPTP